MSLLVAALSDVPADSALGEIAPALVEHLGAERIKATVTDFGTREELTLDVSCPVGMVENAEPGKLKLAFGEHDPQILSRFVFDHTGKLLADKCSFNILLDRDGNRG